MVSPGLRAQTIARRRSSALSGSVRLIIVSLTFLVLIHALGRTGAFWLYAAVGVVTLWFCWKLVPETKGKRLEEIEEIFRQRVKRRGAEPTPKPPAPVPPPTAPA
jgi:Sugar (and other) transporter